MKQLTKIKNMAEVEIEPIIEFHMQKLSLRIFRPISSSIKPSIMA
jgi:hypothetical protein